MALEIQRTKIEIGPVTPGQGITPRTMTAEVRFKNELHNKSWWLCLNGFHLQYTGGDDLSVLKQQVNIVRGVLDPRDGSNHTLEIEVAFLLADDNGEASFKGWADVVAIAQV
jgi:hypothetical protein